jgi:hypothetical protein
MFIPGGDQLLSMIDGYAGNPENHGWLRHFRNMLTESYTWVPNKIPYQITFQRQL